MEPPVYPTITLDLILDRVYTKEVLHGVLHSILFHRLFGTIKPQTIEVLDVTMPGVDNPEMEQLVNEKVDAFWKGIEGGSKRGQILVTFSERKPKKSWFQVYMGEEDVPWEQWIINAELRQLKSDQERASLHSALSSTLTKIVFTMLTHTSSEQGRAAVPLITNAAGISPFPIQINVKVGDVEPQATIPYHIQSAMVQRHGTPCHTLDHLHTGPKHTVRYAFSVWFRKAIPRLQTRPTLLAPLATMISPVRRDTEPRHRCGVRQSSARGAELGSRDYTVRGNPTISPEKVQVQATVIEHTKGSMETKFKKKRRKGYQKTIKHKHPFTRLRIGDIVINPSESS
ncbi:hypothetical protein NMY22_g10635 [Coprinellus aureogranulatus]|nr:hypothetical protein NMY22_g10635 [Coprinellus aureogranulatus]